MRFPFKANSILKVHVSLGLGCSLEMFYTVVALLTGSETSTWLSPQNKYFFHHVIWTYPGCPLPLSMTTADLCPRYTTFWKWPPHHILSLLPPLSVENLIIIIIRMYTKCLVEEFQNTIWSHTNQSAGLPHNDDPSRPRESSLQLGRTRAGIQLPPNNFWLLS